MKTKPAISAVTTALFCILLGGCQSHSKTPTQKEVAVKEWNHARSAVLASLAKSQFESGNIDKGQQTIEEALRLSPDDATLHVLAGKIFIEKGLLEQADREL